MYRTPRCAHWSWRLPPIAFAAAAAGQQMPAGTIVTWGEGGGLIPVPAGTYVKVAAGPTHALALRSDGTVVGWGENVHGQATPPPGQFIDIAAGGTGVNGRSLGLLADGTPVLWGSSEGFPPPPPGTFAKIRAKYDYAVLITPLPEGALVYWGPPSNPVSSVPAGAYFDVAPGKNHAIGNSFSPFGWIGWGDNSFGQATVPAGINPTSIQAGAAHSVAVSGGGVLSAWGSNAAGQTSTPPGTFARVAARDDWSAALRTGAVSVLASWGADPTGAALPQRWFGSVEAGETFGLALSGCYADCNGSGTLTVVDFTCVRTAFVTNNVPYMDCNGDGHLTVAEFTCFQTWFVADMSNDCAP